MERPGRLFLRSFYRKVLPVAQLYIVLALCHALVSRTDDLAVVGQLFDAVRAPTHDTCHGKDRSIKLQGQIQHAVYKAAVEVHIGADALVDLAFLADDLGSQTFYHGVESKFLFPSLLNRMSFYEGFEDIGTGIREGVNRVAHTVDETCVVEGFLMKQSAQIAAYLFLIGPVLYLLLHILKHPHYFYVGAAVAGTL